jgi:LysM repeat protein
LSDILAANGAAKTDILRVGQEVLIPVRKSIVEQSSEYIVKQGDTLSSVARENSITVNDLRNVNDLHDDKLVVGQKLTIRGKKSSAGNISSDAVQHTAEYIVKRRDTLSQIASSHGMRMSELVALNKIKEPDRIREGQRLIVRRALDDEVSTMNVWQSPHPKVSQPRQKTAAARLFDDDLLGLFDDEDLFNVNDAN